MSGSGVLRYPTFVRFWLADAVSSLGTFVSGLALQLLLIQTLQANQTEVGLVRAAQWVPYLLFGLLAGVVVDRVRRRPVLIIAESGCAALFAAIAILALTDLLTVPILAALVFGVGAASMYFRAAHQSLLPNLVPLALLPAANARLEQTMAVAQSIGPLVAGLLVRFLSAPIAMAIDALSYAVSACMLGTLRVTEVVRDKHPDRHVWRELKEGARWVYRHTTLAPYAIALHLWFFFNSLVTTVLVFFATVELHLGAVTIGIILACAGITGVLGAGLAPALGDRFGLGRVCTAAEWLSPLSYVLVLIAPPGWGGVVLLVCSQLLFGFGLGVKGPLDTSYRNAVTPDRLRARMNATIRSVNWGSIAVSAPLGGLIAATWGNRSAIAVGIVGLVGAALLLMLSPFRWARMPDHQTED